MQLVLPPIPISFHPYSLSSVLSVHESGSLLLLLTKLEQEHLVELAWLSRGSHYCGCCRNHRASMWRKPRCVLQTCCLPRTAHLNDI